MLEFDVAVSFAGENRDFVEKIVSNVKGAIGSYSKHSLFQITSDFKSDKHAIFYDNDNISCLAGEDLITKFKSIYGKCKYIFGFVDINYITKSWTALEQSIIKERLLEDRFAHSFFVPIILDNTYLDFYPNYMGYIDGRDKNAEKLTQIILDKIYGQSIAGALKYINPENVNDAFKLIRKDIRICFTPQLEDDIGDKVIMTFRNILSFQKTVVLSNNLFGMSVITLELRNQINSGSIRKNFLADCIIFQENDNWVLFDSSNYLEPDNLKLIHNFTSFNDVVEKIIKIIRIFLRNN